MDQPIFWALDVLPTIIPIVPTDADSDAVGGGLSLTHLNAADIRQTTDGWYIVLRVGNVEHRLHLPQRPVAGESYAAKLSFDQDFGIRVHAASRLWRMLHGQPPGPAYHELSPQRRKRLVLALRALDGRTEGCNYRAIATVLFGAKAIPERAWKTHDLRNRTIRLVQTGLALMRGGYRNLLHQNRRSKRGSG